MPPDNDEPEVYTMNGVVLFRKSTGSYLEVSNIVGNWSLARLDIHIQNVYPGWIRYQMN